MKTITVKNLSLQFDSFDEGADRHNGYNMIDNINHILQEYFPDACPRLWIHDLNDDSVEINISEDERTELIDKLLEHKYKGDHSKYEDSNRAFLETLSDDELQNEWDEWKNSME